MIHPLHDLGYWRRRLAHWERRAGIGSWFYTRSAARVVGKSQRTIQRHVQLQRLASQGGRGSGRHIRILREDLLAYLLREEGVPERVLEELLAAARGRRGRLSS